MKPNEEAKTITEEPSLLTVVNSAIELAVANPMPTNVASYERKFLDAMEIIENDNVNTEPVSHIVPNILDTNQQNYLAQVSADNASTSENVFLNISYASSSSFDNSRRYVPSLSRAPDNTRVNVSESVRAEIDANVPAEAAVTVPVL